LKNNSSDFSMLKIQNIPIFFTLGIFIIVPSHRNSKILKVPADFKTIQAAMDRAEAGDIVSARGGTYIGRIILKAGVSLLGSGPEFTRIQGDGRGDVVIAADKAVVSGFTIEASGPLYSAIRCDSTSPLIKSNIITHNGAGIFMSDSNAIIEHNLIVENDDESDFGTFAIFCRRGNPVIRNNTIANNYARFAILCDHSFPEVVRNIIAFNLGGIGCENDSGPVLIQNNLWANTVKGNYQGCQPGRDSLSKDPLFIDIKSGDYRLSPESPCITDEKAIGTRGYKIVTKKRR